MRRERKGIRGEEGKGRGDMRWVWEGMARGGGQGGEGIREERKGKKQRGVGREGMGEGRKI